MLNLESVLESETHRIWGGVEILKDNLMLARWPDILESTTKNVRADHRVKLKESEKKKKYQDFARELKKLRNMKMIAILNVIDVLGKVTRGLIQGLDGMELRDRVGARGVMVIVIGNGHGDTSLNPGRDWLHFT